MTRRLICCLLLSYILHLLLIWLPGFSPQLFAYRVPLSNVSEGKIEARLKIFDSRVGFVDRNPEQGNVRQSVSEGAELRSPEHPAAATVAVIAASPSPLPILPPSLPHGFDRDAYLPGSRLDLRPIPNQAIVVGVENMPGFDMDKGQAIMVLFIGAEGTVDHVDIDSTDMPPDVTVSLADIFRAASMSPGWKDGQPAKSRMKIQVDFERR